MNALLEQLEETPARVRLQHPRTGDTELVTIDRTAATGIVRSALYSPEVSALVPLVIDRAAEGDFAPLAALGSVGGGMAESISLGMFLSVVCSEDVPVTRGEPFANTLFRGAMWKDVESVCQWWPHVDVDPAFHEPVESDVPTLLLSGDLDPATPPSWAEEAAATLARSHHVVVPGAGHGTWAQGCMPRLIRRFIEVGDPATVNDSCVEDRRRPPFFVNRAGPVPARTEE